MKLIISLLLLANMAIAQSDLLGNGGGDDAGNGGFAYKQSIIILKLAANDLQSKISSVNLNEFQEHPEWRTLLQNVLKYDNLEKSWWWSKVRNGQPLSMDYNVKKPKVIVLKLFYQTFMGKTDNEIPDATLEVEKRLLHEASHIWGYNENDSEDFAERFLSNANNEQTRTSGDITIKSNFCSCLNGKSDIINDCDSFCATQINNSTPTLYLETILGKETLKNPHIKSLYDWCNVQLDGEYTIPKCSISAMYDGGTLVDIPVMIDKNSNKLSADLSRLNFNTSYILKIVEYGSGSNAESREFQLRRVKQVD